MEAILKAGILEIKLKAGITFPREGNLSLTERRLDYAVFFY